MRAGRRGGEIRILEAVDFFAQLRELRDRELRHFRELRNRLRLRRVDVAGQNRIQITSCLRNLLFLRRAINSDPAKVVQCLP